MELEEVEFELRESEQEDSEPVVEPSPPSEAIIADFHDERNRLDYYWSTVEELDVPTPETTIFELSEDPCGGMPQWDTDGILDWMQERDAQQAFVRSAYKSAMSSEGRFIYTDTEAVVDETIAEMLTSHIMQKMPHGGVLVVREYLDLDFSFYARGDCHPEIRFFIDRGEITAATPRLNSNDFICEEQFELARDMTKRGIERVLPYVETVAENFTDSPWSVDFVMDTNRDWYLTEMGLNGVYYRSDREEWANICGHGEVEDISPAVVYSNELPKEPKESLKSQLR